jgi:hypothetical protein
MEDVMAFQVLKGVPMPQSAKKTYNFEDLEVGDMMFVPIKADEEPQRIQNNVGSSATSWGKRHQRKFQTQLIKNGGQLGVGVWRVE